MRKKCPIDPFGTDFFYEKQPGMSIVAVGALVGVLSVDWSMTATRQLMSWMVIALWLVDILP
jgi:hypothetical protein